MTKMNRAATALMLAVCVQGAVWAKPKEQAIQMNADQSVSQQLEMVESALGKDEYSEIKLEERNRVQSALARIKSIMGDHERLDQLAPGDRTEIYNQQETINTILTRGHADSRMVCKRERSTGSNLPKQVCMTVAQRRVAAENARDTLQYQLRSQAPTDKN